MIARKTTLIILQNAIGMAVGYLALKLIAIELGPDEIGMVAFGFSIVALFSFLANLGYNAAHVKRISEGKDLGTCIGTYAAIKLALTGLLAGVFILALTVWKYMFPSSIHTTTEGILYAVLAYYIFLNLAAIPIITFEARTETSKSQVTYLLQHPVKMVLVLMIIFLAPMAAQGKANTDPDTAYNLSLAYYSLVSLVVMISAWAIFLIHKYPIKRPTMEMARSYTKFALPIFVTSFTGVLIVSTDKFMLGFFGDASLVGEYYAVQKLSEMMLVVPMALSMILFPILSNLNAKKLKKAMQRILVSSERYTSMILVPVMLFIFFFSRPIIHILLSDDFLVADFTLSFLGVFAFMTAMTRPRAIILQAIDRPDLVTRVSIVMGILNFLLNLILIPDWFGLQFSIPGWLTPTGVTHTIFLSNHTGAAIATLSSATVGFILLRLLTWKWVKSPIYHGFTLRHLFGSIIMIVALLFLFQMIGMDRWYHLLMYIFVGLGIYVLVLAAMKEFKKGDLNFYLGLLNPKALKDYMSRELKEKDLSVALDDLSREEE